MPRGLLKLAAAPAPSAKASAPLPARVLTAPERDTARTRLFSESHTYTSPTASITSTPAGRLKAAAVPWPFKNARLSLPASVEAFHTQGGSALSPAAAQFAALKQGTAGAGVPPGQKKPGAHSVALAAAEPAAHPKPGAAVQGVGVEESGGQKNPAGHSAGTPATQKYEAGQGG